VGLAFVGLLLANIASAYAASGRTIVVLVDLSESTNREGAREDYKKYFNKVLEGLGGGETLVVARIVERPINDSIIDVNESFGKFNMFRDNERRFKEKEAQKKQAVRQAFGSLLDGQAKLTPILDTVYLAERLFQTYPAVQKTLVILSDMVEESGHYNFQKLALGEAQSAEILKQLRDRKRMPNLGGVNVYVAGARHKDVDKGLRIKSFWMQYFAANGGTMKPEDYGPELLVFK